ncbi:MAG: hypothetical protein JRE18_04620 [Deltaproteobacteria bacterium]|jgi:hypothetical protein|nr:hypothetical protein [Deltaproteobacteria bacterium]
MIDTQNVIEGQLKSLTEKVDSLQAVVDELSARMHKLEKGEPLKEKRKQVQAAIPPLQEQQANLQDQQGMLKKAGTGALLPRVAAVCFALVIALTLRTISDNEIINIQLGSMLGLGYAAALIIGGWWLYSRLSRLAPVFPACGLLLLFSVVLESHGRFESLSSVMAYIILFIAGSLVMALGLRYRASSQLCLAGLGTGLVGMSIDFPYPVYPLLALLLFGGAVSGYIASRQKICPSLRYTTFGLIIVFWLFWAFKLNVPPTCDEPTAAILHLSWFYPLLLIIWLFFTVTNIHRIATDTEDLGFFESLLPTIAGVGAFLAAWSVTVPWYRTTLLLGIVGVLAGLLHLVAGGWLAARNKEGAIGSTTYTFAGILLLSLGVAAIFSNLLWSVPILSVSAYLLARVANRWQSGGIRCTSYLFQLVAGVVAVASGVVAADFASPLVGSLVIGTLMTMSFLQYRWCRSHAPPLMHSAFFSWLDRKDFSAVILLLTGLMSGFFLLRLGLYQILARSTADLDFMFRGGQTVFINLGAVFLLMVASRRKNTEILTVAIVVGLLGMLKSFVFDLFGIKGMPLVFSVFSSGVVAAVGSVVSSRWQGKKEKAKQGNIAVPAEGLDPKVATHHH